MFPRVNVLGVGVHAINMRQALTFLLNAASSKQKGYVCVTGVHGVMEAQDDVHFRDLLNRSLLTVPDGMPTVWVGHAHGYYCMSRVFGPDLMLQLCRASLPHEFRHFLYGGAPGVVEQLKGTLQSRCPNLQVVGTYTPPFRPLTLREEHGLVQQVRQCKPDFLWVGLSTPKQEMFMAEYLPKLDVSVMIGVGAAFDLHTGRMKDSADWVKNAGLQWAHRLLQDPLRLWKRYLINNPRFVALITAQLLGLRHYDLPPIESPPPAHYDLSKAA